MGDRGKWSVSLGILLPLVAPPALAAGDCGALDDPFQVLDFHLEMAPSDWQVVLHTPCCDGDTPSPEKPATFRCGDGPGFPIRVRRKPTGMLPSTSDPVKPSLKIDFDDLVPDAEWLGQRKLSLENGWGGVLVKEGLAWILMGRSGIVTGQVSWVRLEVNGSPVGVYTRVEQVDKSFLRRRVGDDEGYLFKEKVRQTRVGEADPLADLICFPPFSSGCPLPDDGFASLHDLVDLPQLLTLAAVNAFLTNRDGLLANDLNYWMYDLVGRPRLYFPWDLDQALGLDPGVDPHRLANGSSTYEESLLRVPFLRSMFDDILSRLIAGPFHPDSLDALLDEISAKVGPAIDADPLNDLPGGFAAEREGIRSWLRSRVAALRGSLRPPADPPIVIGEVLASNRSTVADEAGEFDDWVELWNRTDQPATLAGLHLSDDPATPLRFGLPDVVVPAHGAVLVWCDGDRRQGPLHAPFDLDRDGDAVGLWRIESGIPRIVDFVRFFRQEPDVSIGLDPAGPPYPVTLPCPTPGRAPNAPCPPPGSRFIRGDLAADGTIDISDPVTLLAGLFQGADLACPEAGDLDGDGRLEITDAVVLLSYLFLAGPPPPPPFPGCGVEAPSSGLGCPRDPPCE